MKSRHIKVLLAIGILAVSAITKVTGQNEQGEAPRDSSQSFVINNTDWFDVEGRPIMAHEGDIAEFDGVYYWYGSSYENNPTGKFDIADGPVWNGVQVYKSTDLINWTYRGVALPRPEKADDPLQPSGMTGPVRIIEKNRLK
jgi:hypothetical protein